MTEIQIVKERNSNSESEVIKFKKIDSSVTERVATVFSVALFPLFFIFCLGSWGITSIKHAVKPPLYIQKRDEIFEKMIKGLKNAAQKYTPPLLEQDDEIKNNFLKGLNSLKKEIENSSVSMNQIDKISTQIHELSAEYFKLKECQENKIQEDFELDENIVAGFQFLKECARARMVTDGIDANKEYGNRKASKKKVQTVDGAVKSWEKSLERTFKISKDSLVNAAHFAITHPIKQYNTILSNFDREGAIKADAFLGNPSYVAHEVNGMKFVHSPTPSATKDAALFKMYLESLKEKNQRHIHFQYQSPDHIDDWARIHQMQKIAKDYPETFDQVVFSFDGLSKGKGKGLAEDFKREKNIGGFFCGYKEDLFGNKESVEKTNSIYIPTHILTEEQITQAFETAEEISRLLYSAIDSEDSETLEAFPEVMQACLYGVLMTAITHSGSMNKVTDSGTVTKHKVEYISGGCKQDVDRGPILNLMMKFFDSLQNNEKISQEDIHDFFSIIDLRPKIGDYRFPLKSRLKIGIDTLRVISSKLSTVQQSLKKGIEEIKKNEPCSFDDNELWSI